MRQYGILAAVFGGTLAVLLVAFLVVEQMGAGNTAAVASPSPSATAAAVASAPPPATIPPKPSATADPSTAASSTPGPGTPAGTPRPTPTKAPPVAPGSIIEVVVLGHDFVESEIASNGTITTLASGGILMSSTRDLSDLTSVTYLLPRSQIPAGTIIKRLDVAVCGKGEGDFWETYGPPDANPSEHEATDPDADGCWHYLDSNGKDSTSKAIIEKRSTLRVDKVVYTITTG